ncbi:MAG: HlyD family efflux transporter periplasmic adaptor subunit [Bryobacteraceae bacterium]
MKTASGPATPLVTPGPRRVVPPPGRPGWIAPAIVIVCLILAGLALFLRTQSAGHASRKAESSAIRTATVGFGAVQKTVRIAGSISAERFAALLAPRLRGSRRDRGRGGSGGSSTTSTTSGGASSSAGTSGAGTSTSASTSTTTTTTSSIGAQRGTTNRFNDAASKASQKSAGSAQSSTAASGGANLGSTSGSLFSASSGGGGSDFMLVLIKVAPAGARVKKGDVVAEFDRQYMLLRLDDYKDSVAQLEANLKKMRADLAVAKEAHNQQVRSAKAAMDKAELDLKTIEVRSAIESEEFRLNAEEARAHYRQILQEVKLFDESQRAQLRNSEIERDQALIELKRAEANVDRMILKAPFDGVVVMQTIFRGGQFGQVQQGDQIWPGMNFMSIVDPSSMVVNAMVNQTDSELLRLGLKADVHVDAYPDMQLPATVIGIGAITKPAGWRPNYFREIPVRLKLDQMDPRVLPDLSASASILLATESEAPVAPLEAIFRDREDPRPFVFLRSPNGWMRREVELGLSNQVAVSVRSGLQKGDVIAAQRPL